MRALGKHSGFTLIELVMVILLLAVIAAVAIPNFIDFRTDAKNAATQGALGAFRSAISIAVAAIALKEDPSASASKYPTYDEMSNNAFDANSPANHGVLSGQAIMDPSTSLPENPWTRSSAPLASRNFIYDCSGLNKTDLLAAPNNDRGWCYNEITGEFWPNSDLNSGGANKTENYY